MSREFSILWTLLHDVGTRLASKSVPDLHGVLSFDEIVALRALRSINSPDVALNNQWVNVQ